MALSIQKRKIKATIFPHTGHNKKVGHDRDGGVPKECNFWIFDRGLCRGGVPLFAVGHLDFFVVRCPCLRRCGAPVCVGVSPRFSVVECPPFVVGHLNLPWWSAPIFIAQRGCGGTKRHGKCGPILSPQARAGRRAEGRCTARRHAAQMRAPRPRWADVPVRPPCRF